MTQAPQQMPLLFGAESPGDWADAEGWHSAKVHACAIGQRADARFYIGDGPTEGQIGIHSFGCWYQREDAA